MGIQAPSLEFGSNTPTPPRRPRRKFRNLDRRVRIALVATAAAIGLITTGAAYAETTTSVSYATATASPVAVTHSKLTSNVSTKITLENEKAKGGKTSAKCYRGATFKSIFKAHKSAKCVVITKNGQTFMNSAISSSGKRVWFNDHVGSIDSKAGTSSATWYWVASTKTWHKGNCWNTNKLQGYKPAAHSVSYYHIVQTITWTLTQTISSTGKVVVTANANCVQGGASASSSAQAIAEATATQTFTVHGSTKVEAQANAKAEAKKLAAKLQQSAMAGAISKAKSTAKGSITITLSATASAQATCSETTPPPTQTTTPPPAPKQIQVCRLGDKQIVTINEDQFNSNDYSLNLADCKTVTPPPTTTPPPTKTPQPIQVCRLSDKQIVTIDKSEFDSSKYSTNLEDCKTVTPPPTTTPPTPKQIQVCRLSDHQIVTISEDQFNSNDYSKNLADCKVTPPPTTTPPAPQPPTISITHINQVPFGDSRPDTQVTYMVPGSDKYTITVVAGDGTITSKSDDGNGTLTFTYNAPNDVQYQNGGTDTVTATIKDTTTGLTAQAVTQVTIAPALPSK